MTTIAYDGKMIACDTLTTSNFDMVLSRDKTKIISKNGVHIGMSGYAQPSQRAAEYLLGIVKEKPKFKENGDEFTLLIVSKDYVRMCGRDLVPFDVDAPVAVGTGDQVAVGAMLAGKTARQAVALAMERDVFTGGRVRSRTVIP